MKKKLKTKAPKNSTTRSLIAGNLWHIRKTRGQRAGNLARTKLLKKWS